MTDLFSTFVSGLALVGALGATRLIGGESARSVTFEVHCSVTDPDNHPLGGGEWRLVLTGGSEARQPGSGVVVRPGADGTAIVQIPGVLRESAIKRPSNFVDSLFSRKEATDLLEIAAELPYLGGRLLYVFPLHRFRADGTVLESATALYAADAQGRFTREVEKTKQGDWLLPAAQGLAVAGTGWALAGSLFRPDEQDPSGQRWVLDLRFKRSPEPVRR